MNYLRIIISIQNQEVERGNYSTEPLVKTRSIQLQYCSWEFVCIDLHYDFSQATYRYS